MLIRLTANPSRFHAFTAPSEETWIVRSTSPSSWQTSGSRSGGRHRHRASRRPAQVHERRPRTLETHLHPRQPHDGHRMAGMTTRSATPESAHVACGVRKFDSREIAAWQGVRLRFVLSLRLERRINRAGRGGWRIGCGADARFLSLSAALDAGGDCDK
jgi:hypothetical protein